MCGICGFTGYQDSRVIKNMTSRLYHRGPDEDGFYCDEYVSLGMRRLSIIDLKTGKQPVYNEEKNVWVIFNGEIYNHKLIRQELQKKGHEFYTHHSDTEVIVHLYEEYGDGFPNYINGMFAIALWDTSKRRLLLVRDRMGVKPLFYTLVSGNLVFASEIKSILCYPEYKKDICYEGVFHYFSYKNVPSPLTAFKDVYTVQPGQVVSFENGVIESRRYWRINFSLSNSYNEEELKEKIGYLLEDSVKIRMNSDVPFGAYLSGGVDSSAVVAYMSKYHDKPIKTFSLGYKDQLTNKDEDLYYARKVSKVFNTDHYEYIMSSRELMEDIDSIIESFDQPFSGTISTYFLSKLIKKHVKVALSGDGADELFGSYLAHRLAQPMYHFSRLYDKYKNNKLSLDEIALLEPYSSNIQYLVDLHNASGGNRSDWRSMLFVFSDVEKTNILAKSFMENLNNYSSSKKLIEEQFNDGTTDDPLNSILELDWNTLLPDQVLAFVDFLSMAHSIEVRSPFLDYRLVELVSSIPGSYKIRNGVVKSILKKSVEGVLPEGITQRPKEGFVLPIFYWMMGQLKNYISSELSKEKLSQHTFFNVESITGLLNSFESGNMSVAPKLWNIVMFQVWYRRYFGGA
ncbi:MAG: asparagine synthase (glutamine-hydrolyzing) [Bacillota bacterium]